MNQRSGLEGLTGSLARQSSRRQAPEFVIDHREHLLGQQPLIVPDIL
jgi:hypothetical protein